MWQWYCKNWLEVLCWAVGGALAGIVLGVMVAAMLGDVTVVYG